MNINWKDHLTNADVLGRVKGPQLRLYRTITKQKMAFAGHVIRGSGGRSAVTILEGKTEGTRARDVEDL